MFILSVRDLLCYCGVKTTDLQRIQSKGIVLKPCTWFCVTEKEKLHLGVHVTNGSLIGVEVTKHWHMIKDIMTYEVHMGDSVSHG